MEGVRKSHAESSDPEAERQMSCVFFHLCGEHPQESENY